MSTETPEVQDSQVLIQSVSSSQKKEQESRWGLEEQKTNQKSLLASKNSLQQELNDLVSINDTDREQIIKQTKEIDKIKIKAKKFEQARANLKPGEQLSFDSKFLSSNDPIFNIQIHLEMQTNKLIKSKTTLKRSNSKICYSMKKQLPQSYNLMKLNSSI